MSSYIWSWFSPSTGSSLRRREGRCYDRIVFVGFLGWSFLLEDILDGFFLWASPPSGHGFPILACTGVFWSCSLALYLRYLILDQYWVIPAGSDDAQCSSFLSVVPFSPLHPCSGVRIVPRRLLVFIETLGISLSVMFHPTASGARV